MTAPLGSDVRGDRITFVDGTPPEQRVGSSGGDSEALTAGGRQPHRRDDYANGRRRAASTSAAL